MSNLTPDPGSHDRPNECGPGEGNRASALAPRISRVALAAYVSLLVFSTHSPYAGKVASGATFSDKTLHFVAYAVLSFLALAALDSHRRGAWKKVVKLFVVLAIFGALDELTQPPFGRTADWLDWYADLCGLAAGIALFFAAGILLRAAGVWQFSDRDRF